MKHYLSFFKKTLIAFVAFLLPAFSYAQFNTLKTSVTDRYGYLENAIGQVAQTI